MKKSTKQKSEENDINLQLDMYQMGTSTIEDSRFQILKIPIIILILGTLSHHLIKCTQMNTSIQDIIRLLKK